MPSGAFMSKYISNFPPGRSSTSALGEKKLLRRSLLADRLQSAVLYGPTGSGKTTLGYIIARMTHSHFIQINSVSSNSQELRKYTHQAQQQKKIHQDNKTILFIDEIHRFNKSQQDILMPSVEHGDIILIGATTHNPAFSLNGPLLSRSLIFELKPLSEENIITIMKNALADKKNGYGNIAIDIEDRALSHIAEQSCGDARRALNTLKDITREPFSVIVRDASIQRFEHTFEAFWKFVREYLKVKEGIVANSPKACFKEIFFRFYQ